MTNNPNRPRKTVLTIKLLELFPLNFEGLPWDIETDITDDDFARWVACPGIFSKLLKAIGKNMCPPKFKAGCMILSVWDCPDLFDHPGDKIFNGLLNTASELTRNADSEAPLPTSKAVSAPANVRFLKELSERVAPGSTAIEIHTSNGPCAPPVLPARVFAEPAPKGPKRRTGTFEIRGVDLGIWGDERALYITQSRVRVLIPTELDGFDVDRLIGTLHEPSYLHATIVQEAHANSWIIDPGATISSQQSLSL